MREKRELKDTLLFEKNHHIHGGIYHKLQVDFAYNSNHMEGSRLTHEQTRYIFETQRVDGTVFVNDVFETANHFRCLDWVLDTVSEPLSEEYIKQMHRILEAGLKEWQTQDKPNRLLDVFLSMQDDMKAVLDYFEIDYDHTETTSRALVEQHKN